MMIKFVIDDEVVFGMLLQPFALLKGEVIRVPHGLYIYKNATIPWVRQIDQESMIIQDVFLI